MNIKSNGGFMSAEDLKNEWHLDRKVTLALIGAILFNAGTSIWWAASLNARVLQHEEKIAQNAAEIGAVTLTQNGVGERLAKVEAGIVYQTKILDRIEGKLGR